LGTGARQAGLLQNGFGISMGGAFKMKFNLSIIIKFGAPCSNELKEIAFVPEEKMRS